MCMIDSQSHPVPVYRRFLFTIDRPAARFQQQICLKLNKKEREISKVRKQNNNNKHMSTTLGTKTIRTNVAKPSIESYNIVILIKQKKKSQNLLNTNL